MGCFHRGAAHRKSEEGVVTRYTQQAQADYQHAGDGPALESYVQSCVEAGMCSLCGAHVGAH